MTKKTRIGARGILGAILVSVCFSVFADAVVYDNFGDSDSFGGRLSWQVGAIPNGLPVVQAMEFTPTQDGDLSVIEVGMGPLLNPNGRNAFAASIRVDADGKPDLVLESIVVFDKVLTTSDTIVRFVSVETPYLDSSRIYWLVLEPIDDFFSAWATSEQDEKGTEASSTDMGMSWSFSPLQTLGAFRISVAPVPTLTCSGFESPLARGPVEVKKNRKLPFKAQLIDSNGQMVDDSGVVAPPVMQVIFEDSVDVSDDVLSSGAGTNGGQFEFLNGKWRFKLKVKNFTGKGTYTVTMESGDSTEYQIDDPTCTGQFVIK